MDLQQTVAEIHGKGASDLHLEPGLPPVARFDGVLAPLSKEPVEGDQTRRLARSLLKEGEWARFLEQRSFDLSCMLGRVRCRVNVMRTARGVGLAIRLLSSFQPTLERLNLHPDLAKLVQHRHGLVLVCGPTGSGKSSTLAALIHEINTRESLHIVTVESPIEYTFLPRRSFIRQREVGRDTPSFDRAIIDAMRQDPDVIMVGEMRERETIRLTLTAAETGQLVLSTLHSSSTAEAVQRMVSAFPAEIQGAVCGQIADSLVAVVAQRLRFHEKHGIRVPVCEILMGTHPVRNLIRQGQFFKLPSVLETGHGEGCWTFRRYRQWVDSRRNLYVPTGAEPMDTVPERADEPRPVLPKTPEAVPRPKVPGGPGETGAASRTAPPAGGGKDEEDVIVIEEPEAESLEDLLRRLEGSREDEEEDRG